MTYCVGLCLKDGLVFLSDTRTNAGVDQIGTFRKMSLFQKDKDRFFTLMSAGNIAITQAVKDGMSKVPMMQRSLLAMLLNRYMREITNP
jgi:putative proteasome-type protease